MESFLHRSKQAFDNRSFEEIGEILNRRKNYIKWFLLKLKNKFREPVQKNPAQKIPPYIFHLLLETKDLMTATINLLELYYEMHDRSVELARVD